MLTTVGPASQQIATQQITFGTLDPTSVILTAVVLFLALAVGPWLARRAGNVPQRIDPQLWHTENRHGKVSRRERRVFSSAVEGSHFVTWVTLLCVWVAAAVAIAYIWLYGKGVSGTQWRQIVASLKVFGLRLGGSLIVLALALTIGRLLQRVFVASLTGAHLNDNLLVLGKRTIYFATLVVAAVIILSIWGTGLVVPVTLIGALTVALSLALQGILSNLVAGIYLLIEHPFTIGQTITANGSDTGVVEDIRVRVTILRTESGERILIPNSLIFSGAVVNKSAPAERRAILRVTMAQTGSRKIAEVRSKALVAVRSEPQVLPTPSADTRVVSTANRTLVMDVAFSILDGRTDHEQAVIAAVKQRLKGALGKVQIEDVSDQSGNTPQAVPSSDASQSSQPSQSGQSS